MNENLDPSPVNLSPEEKEFENNLRPSSFDEFSGQDQVIDNLKIFGLEKLTIFIKSKQR